MTRVGSYEKMNDGKNCWLTDEVKTMTQRKAIFSLLIALTMLGLTTPGQAANTNDRPNVLIDLSHEFTFRYDAFLPVGYLLPEGYEVTHSLATLTATRLDKVDILVIEQATTAVPFTTEQIVAIQSFVQNGGSLLLVGKKWAWSPSPFFPSVTRYPLNNLVAIFGITFRDGYGTTPFQVQSHEITQGVTTFDNEGAVPGLLNVDAASTVIVADGAGQPVFAVKEFGAGRVVVSAEDIFVSSPFTGQPLINVRFTQQLFYWLSRGKTTRYPGHTPPFRILPEHQLIQGTVTLYYTEALGPRATFLTDNYPTIYHHLTTGTLLNLNTAIVTENGQAHMGKAMWVIESMESDYGSDFMARLMPLHRQWVQSGRASNPVTMDEFITMLSTVAGTDLSSFFQTIGTHWTGLERVYLPIVMKVNP